MAMPAGRRFYVLFALNLTPEHASSSGAKAAAPASSTLAELTLHPSRTSGSDGAPGAANQQHEIAMRGRKSAKIASNTTRDALVNLRKRGFNRLYQNGRVFEFSTPEELLDVDFTKPVFVVVDRLALTPDIRSRLVDSIEICYREGRGEAVLEFVPDAPGGAPER